LALEARKEKLLSSFNSTYNYTWYFASPDTGLTDKQVTFTFYDQDNLNHVIGEP
jgi:hypothetical protein